MYSIQNIVNIIDGRLISNSGNNEISELVYDTRKIQDAKKALFFALTTTHNDGHKFLQDAYKKGVRNFVVSKSIQVDVLEESNIIYVSDTVESLQKLAEHHRSKFSIPVIGITGSNGKTIVKEWLYQLLHFEYNIARSPRSFNSQIGVPLSVWQLNKQHNLAIFEAGISQVGEMERLQEIIQPNIGIVTNIGEAHSENFSSMQQKLEEKIKLFRHCKTIIYPSDDNAINNTIKTKFSDRQLIGWGKNDDAAVKVSDVTKNETGTNILIRYKGQSFQFALPFTDDASINNAITCCSILLHLDYDISNIEDRIEKLHSIEMRLQLSKGINHCIIINDSYSADLTSLQNALNFLQQQASYQTKTIILSDFIESGKTDEELYNSIAQTLELHGIKKVLGVGRKITQFLPLYLAQNIQQTYFNDTDDFIKHFRSSNFREETILIKGARKFSFERIVQLFEQKVHQTLLEINLNAIAHNLKEYRKLLEQETKVMAMVKAFAYGSGGAEIAGVLQFNNVDYLGVAYADEGIDLRKAGISLPIMVMNADESSFNGIIENNLQPVIYSFDILKSFHHYLSEQGIDRYPVHIEIETGMNRLGFSFSEIEELGKYLKENEAVKAQSVFSHLAASDDEKQDDFTLQQFSFFLEAVKTLEQFIAYPFIRHISNSAAIIRHPNLQMDMVRLGIGLYGVEIATSKLQLQPVATLRSTIAQIKHIKKGETVSYNRRGIVTKDSVIATVRIGYADGYSRKLSNGVGKMWIKGKLAPVIGTVCMDMTMVDVTDIEGVNVGEEVIVFGDELPLQDLANWAGTIPYEIMTSVSQRVKRTYFHE